MQQQETFREFGYGFQIKILANYLTDREFLSRSIEVIKPEYFDGTQLQWICKIVYEYFGEYRKMPTLEVFKGEIVKKLETHELLKTEVITSLRDIYKAQGKDDDSKYIQEEALEFSKNQALKAAILKSVELLKNRKYDSIRDEIENSLKLGLVYDLGLNVTEEVDEAHEEENLVHITTGWPVIDEITSGGLPKRKLGGIMGSLGSGKTWVAVHLGASAAEAGYTVMHYSLELTRFEVAQRYQAKLTGISMDNLVVHMNSVKSRIKNTKGKIFIKDFLEGVTLSGIINHLEQSAVLGIIPDVVIIDYDELIDIDLPKDASSADISRALQLLHRNAKRKIAVAKDVALWIPIQATKEGSEEDIVRSSHSAGSYGKGRELDFLMTLSRKDKDKVSNTARFSVQKSRIGPDGMAFPAEFDTSKARIVIHREETTDGKKTRNKMQTDDAFQKDYLKNKLDDFLTSGIINNNRSEPEGDLF